jgi:hypothetical protein
MHSSISYELVKARSADFHRQAERDALVQAARRARRMGREHGQTFLPRNAITNFTRRVLTMLGTRGVYPAR